MVIFLCFHIFNRFPWKFCERKLHYWNFKDIDHLLDLFMIFHKFILKFAEIWNVNYSKNSWNFEIELRNLKKIRRKFGEKFEEKFRENFGAKFRKVLWAILIILWAEFYWTWESSEKARRKLNKNCRNLAKFLFFTLKNYLKIPQLSLKFSQYFSWCIFT